MNNTGMMAWGGPPELAVPTGMELMGSYVSTLVEHTTDIMLMMNPQGVIEDANPAAEEMTGLSRSELVGSSFGICFSEPAMADRLLRRAATDGQMHNLPLCLRQKNGAETEVVCSFFVHRDASGGVRDVFAVLRDLSELKQFETLMLFQAHYDALTALPNRMLFRERVRRMLARAYTGQVCVAVLLIDLDDFKEITETLGLQAGDDLLKKTANRLADAIGGTDTLARMGGDEFAILMECGNEVQVVNKARHILNAVAKPHVIDGGELGLSCSIGIASVASKADDVDVLMRKAEAALYRAKGEGKNICRHFTPDMIDSVMRRVDISKRLRNSVRDNELVLHFQPRAELGTGRLIGMEALLRWNTGGRLVSPAEFIPVAEDNGMIVQIGEWVLFEACRQAKRWLDKFGSAPAMAVNLSVRQVRDVDIVKLVSRVLDKTGLPAHFLELELTEGMLMSNTPRILRMMEGLKDIGVRLAIDDFGTGFSSLSYLKSFPFDYLKLDRSFIFGLPDDTTDGAIVRAIIMMAHYMNLKVIAEGVESCGQLEFLLDQDCDEIQGYYFSKPLCADDAGEWLSKRRGLGDSILSVT
jgi:diguanylate cyclase (GGDEF)-like protein/PAS domain S-box-containing protein